MADKHDDNVCRYLDAPPSSSASRTSSTMTATAPTSSSSTTTTATPQTSHQSSAVTVSDTEDATLVATPSMCYHCFDTLIDTLQHSSSSSTIQIHKRTNASTAVPDFLKQLPDASVECPIFVTWEIQKAPEPEPSAASWQLRGCIGTLSPRLLSTAVGEYAILSALNDRRFRPIAMSEVSSLRVSISLLVQYEKCQDVMDWTIGRHGILIKFDVQGCHYNATYLPEVAKQQGWDHHQAVTSLIHKAGYQGTISKELLQSIRCTRYQSSKCQVTFKEYVLHSCQGEDPLPPAHHNKARQASSWSCINM
jgi:AMME syndrome candidate gene 1 protein